MTAGGGGAEEDREDAIDVGRVELVNPNPRLAPLNVHSNHLRFGALRNACTNCSTVQLWALCSRPKSAAVSREMQ
jgi:hypothetical protein